MNETKIFQVFKCRMCGNIVYGDECNYAIKIRHSNVNAYLYECKDNTISHKCNPHFNDTGIADFIGFSEIGYIPC